MKTKLAKYTFIIIVLLSDLILHRITGLILPKIDLLSIFYVTLYYSRLSLTTLFFFGIIHDIIHIIPLGISSTMYIVTYIYVKYNNKKLLNSTFIIRFILSALLIIFLGIFEYLLVSFHSLSEPNINGFMVQTAITIGVYLLFTIATCTGWDGRIRTFA